MKVSAQHLLLATMLIALPSLFILSCKEKSVISEQSNESSTESGAKLANGEQDESARIFKNAFYDILSQKKQMQSELTQKVDMLCSDLTPEKLDLLLQDAATSPTDRISIDDWLLGYNQLMTNASDQLGERSVESIFKLASNTQACDEMRDYACQHYFRTEARLLQQMENADQRKYAKLLKALDRASLLANSPTKDKAHSTLQGTTLMAISALTMQFASQPERLAEIEAKIGVIVMPILKQWENNQNEQLVCAAMQTASRASCKEVGPIIWSIAMNEKVSTMLRLSAIGSIRPYLETGSIDKLKSRCINNIILKNALAAACR